MLDLSKLTEFNHALIYGFEPESSPQRLAGSETLEDALFPEADQHKDMLDAYLYAQEIILPQIKKIGLSNITPESLIQWVKIIHGFIGKSLMQAHKIKSGEYTDLIVMRWHEGSPLVSHFIFYLAGRHEQKSEQSFAKFLNNKFGVDYQSALDFISLLGTISKDKKYQVHEYLKPFLDYSHPAIEGIIVLNKLASAYNLNQLDNKEKATVSKIVKICMFPPHIPEAMNQWAQETVKRLKSVDASNLTTVSDFLATTFYELTEIHPFGNANGRTATCLNNIFLRSLGYPSIVLRLPGERENKQSLYQKAFAEIDSSLNPLKELISSRVHEATEQILEDKQLKKLIMLRVAFSDLLQETKTKHPKFDLGLFQKQFFSSPDILLAMQIADETEASIMILAIGISELYKKIEELKLTKQQKPNLFTTANLDSNQISDVIERLENISGCSGWKSNSKKGLVWLELLNINEANVIVSKLESLNIAKVTIARRADNQIPVIKCEHIDHKKLISISTLHGHRVDSSERIELEKILK